MTDKLYTAEVLTLPGHRAERSIDQANGMADHTVRVAYGHKGGTAPDNAPQTLQTAYMHPKNARSFLKELQSQGYEFAQDKTLMSDIPKSPDAFPLQEGLYVSFEPMTDTPENFPIMEDVEVGRRTYSRDIPVMGRWAQVHGDGTVHTSARYYDHFSTAVAQVQEKQARYGREAVVLSHDVVNRAMEQEYQQQKEKPHLPATRTAEMDMER